jgi:HPt (histidine-containing phosphotransfer) domain-containing protein
LKSSLANLGEPGLSAIAAKLEKVGRDKDTAAIFTETPGFLDSLRTLTENLIAQLKDNANEEVNEDLPYLHEKLLTIKEACSILDKRTAKDAITELRQRKWSVQNKEQLGKISEYLLFSDFEHAAGVAENIIKIL